MLWKPWDLASASSGRGALAGHGEGPHGDGDQRRSNRVFDTTLTDEKAIAALAITGSSSPIAASGRPTTL